MTTSTQTLESLLLEAGAKVWTSPNGKINRIYISQDVADVVFAELVSYNQAIKLGKAKLFLDVKSGKLFSDSGSIRTKFNGTAYATGWTCGAA